MTRGSPRTQRLRFATRFAILLAAACAASDASAQPGEGFYRNKTVHLVLSTGPAGGYALYGRLLVRHMSEHLPGAMR